MTSRFETDAPSVAAAVVIDYVEGLLDVLLAVDSAEQYLERASIFARDSGASAYFGYRAGWLARHVCDASPLPWRDFRPSPLPAPGRNAACPCGSGRKYKQCCRGREPENACSLQMLLPLFAGKLTAAQRRRAERSAPVDLRVMLAEIDVDTAHFGRAKRMLVPLLDSPPTDPYLHAAVVELLGRVYLDLGQHVAGQAKLRSLTRHKSAPVAAAACVAMARLLLFGDFEPQGALVYVDEALRKEPDNPYIGLVQLQAHHLAGNTGLDERFRAWRRIAEAQENQEAVEQLAALQQRMAALDAEEDESEADADAAAATEQAPHAEGTFVMRGAHGKYELRTSELEAVAAPALELPLLAYHFVEGSTGEGPGTSRMLMLPAAVESAEAAWLTDASAFASPVDWLAAHPYGLQSFAGLSEILDLAAAMSAHADVPLLEALRRQRTRLLEHVLAGTPDDMLLPWGWLENRGLLRAFADDIVENGEQIADLQRLLRLCPEDRLDTRRLLVNRLLQEGRSEEALESITERPEHPHVEFLFGRVLAHAQLGQVGQMEAAFRRAHQALPKVLGALIPERKAPPKRLDPDAVTHGGADQAWYYRRDMRAAFVAVPGLLAFLKGVVGRMDQGR